MIDTIFVDLGNVLVTFKELDKYIQKIAQKTGSDKRQLEAIKIIINKEQLIYEFDTGGITAQQLYRRLAKYLRIEPEIFWPLFVTHLQPIPEVIEFFNQLAKSYRLVAVSNGDPVGLKYLMYTLPVPIQAWFFSWQWKKKKPALLIDIALPHSKTRPNESLFIDDITTYVQAAQAFEISAIQFNAREQSIVWLAQQMSELGIKI